MERQTLEKLAIAFLLMVFVFAIGNMVFNLENLYMGEENLPEYVPRGGSGSDGVATNDTVTNALRWICFGSLGFCVFMVFVAAASFTASRDRKKWRRLLAQMLGVLLGVAAIFAFGLFYDDIESTVMGGGSTNVLPGGGGNASVGGDATVPTGPPDTLRILLTFGIFSILFLFCVVLVMAVNNFLRMRSANLDYSDMERDTREVAETIQRTIEALAGGSDTRATVIRCYTDMCGVMARHGVNEEEHLTPREFQKLALEHLPVPEGQMGALVGVFEEARYSNHALDHEAGRRAMAALEGVKEKLATAIQGGSAQEVPANG